jgi:hypothetical protein
MKARALLQIALHRNIELTRAFAATCQRELFVPTFVIGRAILETGALSWDTHNRLDSVLKARDKGTLEELDEYLVRTLMGSKSTHGFTDPKAFPAPNVITLIDRITKADAYDLRGFYDTLSEVAHPNLVGMQATYTVVNAESNELRFHEHPFRQLAEPVAIAVAAANNGLEMSVTAVQRFNDEAWAFAALCEERIKDRGTWPPSVPYPVQR